METYFKVMAMIVLLLRFVIAMIQAKEKPETNIGRINSYPATRMTKPVKERYKMKLNFTRRIKNVQLFSGHYIDAKALYVLYFDRIPCVCFIGNVDVNSATDYIKKKFSAEIVAVYQHAYFDHGMQEALFNNALFVLAGNRIIEVAIGYVHVLYEPGRLDEAKDLIKALAEFKADPVPTFQTQVVGFARQPEMN
jgi:hypothetical protein